MLYRLYNVAVTPAVERPAPAFTFALESRAPSNMRPFMLATTFCVLRPASCVVSPVSCDGAIERFGDEAARRAQL